ncbi:hypothetical protein [Persephonella sp.]
MDKEELQQFFEEILKELEEKHPDLTEDEKKSILDIIKKSYVNVVSIKGDNNTVINGVGKIDNLRIEVKNKSDDPDIRLLTIRKFYNDKLKTGLHFKPIVNLSALLFVVLIVLLAFTSFNELAQASNSTGKQTIDIRTFQFLMLAMIFSLIPSIIWSWYRNRDYVYDSLPNDIRYIEANYPETEIKKEVLKDLKKLKRKIKILGIF